MVNESDKKRVAEILRTVIEDVEDYGSYVTHKNAYVDIEYLFQAMRIIADMAEGRKEL